MHPRPAGRRCARCLPGRCLRIAGRARPLARLGRGHLDRRDQRGADRRQSAGEACRAPARVLGRRVVVPVPGASAAGIGPGRRGRARRRQRDQRGDGDAVRRHGLLQAARPGGAVPAARHARRDQLLRHRAAQGDARKPRRFRPAQFRPRPLLGRRRRRDERQLPLLRHRRPPPPDRRAPHHGERRLAPGLSADRDRRRLLLGWRHRLQHATAVRPRPARHALAAGLPGRPVRGTGRDARDAG